jgi:hypothetical protein
MKFETSIIIKRKLVNCCLSKHFNFVILHFKEAKLEDLIEIYSIELLKNASKKGLKSIANFSIDYLDCQVGNIIMVNNELIILNNLIDVINCIELKLSNESIQITNRKDYFNRFTYYSIYSLDDVTKQFILLHSNSFAIILDREKNEIIRKISIYEQNNPEIHMLSNKHFGIKFYPNSSGLKKINDEPDCIILFTHIYIYYYDLKKSHRLTRFTKTLNNIKWNKPHRVYLTNDNYLAVCDDQCLTFI